MFFNFFKWGAVKWPGELKLQAEMYHREFINEIFNWRWLMYLCMCYVLGYPMSLKHKSYQFEHDHHKLSSFFSIFITFWTVTQLLIIKSKKNDAFSKNNVSSF